MPTTDRRQGARRAWPLAAVALLAVVLATLGGALGAPATAQSRQCDPGVRRVETAPWQQDRLGYGPDSDLWDAARGAGVSVVVLDTTIAPPDSGAAHPQLRALTLGEPTLSAPPDPDQCYWHGTFVAGLIGAQPVADTPLVGIAPDAELEVVRVTDDVGDVADVAALARGIDRAVAAGADVVNVSLVTMREDTTLRRSVEAAIDAGVVVVAAAGNGDPAGETWPAAIEGVVTVGAVDAADQPAEFSQLLPGAVAVAAPGVDVVSTYPIDAYSQQSGTSFAAALVSGTVALVLEAHPDLTPAQVAHRLRVTADQAPGRLPDPQVGWGVVNPLEAVTAVLPEEDAAVVPPAVAPVEAPGQPAPPDTTLRDRALVLGGVAAVVVVATVALAGAAGAARRRGSDRDRLPTG